MSGASLSKKVLFLNKPDVGSADKLYSEAMQFASPATCGFSDPNAYNFGQYGRNADFDSLRFGGNGAWASPCTNLTQQNLQRRIAVENEQRQFIDFTTNPDEQYPYDTMGVGRAMIEQRSGGAPQCTTGSGWGQQYNMSNPNQNICLARAQAYHPPHKMKSLSVSPQDRLALHYAFMNKYNG